MRRCNLKKLIAAGCAAVTAILLVTVPVYDGYIGNMQHDSLALKREEVPHTNDVVKDTVSGYLMYDFRDSRTFGTSRHKNDTIDFEGYAGFSLYKNEDGLPVYQIYTHIPVYKVESVSIGRIVDKVFTDKKDLTGKKENTEYKLNVTQNGLYRLDVVFSEGQDSTNTCKGYFYKSDDGIKVCRAMAFNSSTFDFLTQDIDNWNYVMQDADPDDYLSNDLITYPTSGENNFCNHTKAWEEISDTLIINDDCSDEIKVLVLTDYIVKNIAYDNYRLELARKSATGNASRASIADNYKDDNNFTLGNNVGVCWDFVNILTIMCRHHGIPATSADYKGHTLSAVWMNDGWVGIDITALCKWRCDTEDTDQSNWRFGRNNAYHEWYGFYEGAITSHDEEIWTREKGKGK